jgi:hypothetical protein
MCGRVGVSKASSTSSRPPEHYGCVEKQSTFARRHADTPTRRFADPFLPLADTPTRRYADPFLPLADTPTRRSADPFPWLADPPTRRYADTFLLLSS